MGKQRGLNKSQKKDKKKQEEPVIEAVDDNLSDGEVQYPPDLLDQ